jgi:hypothetical protein
MASAWTETALLALGPDEYDFQEYKGSALVVTKGALHSELLASLSKQLSAFANGGGGRLFLGIDDDGAIDGGVPTDLKKGGTRSWLEDVVPGLTDPPIAVFNVHEVLPEGPGSRILPGHAVYVIEIAPSDSAPHQAIDHRYYLRIAGKSRPMGHVHLQDVLRRTRHPQVEMQRVAPFGQAERITTDARGPKVMLGYRAWVENRGRTLAHHVGVELILPRLLVNREVRRRMLEEEKLQLTQRPGTVSFFRYHPNPIFPGQDLAFVRFWVAVHGSNLDLIRSGEAEVQWRIYADDAPVRTGSQRLGQATLVKDAVTWVSRQGGAAPPKP